jgi:hypothetical protein
MSNYVPLTPPLFFNCPIDTEEDEKGRKKNIRNSIAFSMSKFKPI